MNRKDFASHLFDKTKMKKYLAPQVFAEICRAQDFSVGDASCKISPECADNFAKGLKKWALSLGATRYTHWFQPLNNFTAGKRDSLFSIDSQGLAQEKFRAKELQKGEGDASSFPSGGLRQTFEARGLTCWDVFSSPFVTDGCLLVPATFVSFNGEALDKKTPLLRSLTALNREAVRLLNMCGFECSRVVSVVGAEQEYFLAEKQKFLRRPDLVFTGRTLIGAKAPKGQEFFDHYYRLPNAKTVAFWQETDSELWKLGIVAKTEHKEVAPNQFELAPCYSPVNIACDQNQIVMHVLEHTAEKFGLVCLLHEKPFAHYNGSGKHNNWSLLTDNGTNLFEQGQTAAENARFVLFLAAVVRAADLHQDLLRFAVASAANDRRLGGFEAPPQTVSVFLGDIYENLLRALNENWMPGIDRLPKTCGLTDRNRTAPFAFTGNKFEFRTVGSSASLADCNTILNTVLAESLKYFADRLEKSRNIWADVRTLVKETLTLHGKIVFSGNNYSDEWRDEANKRGLLNIPNAYLAAKCLSEQKNMELFEQCKVLSRREMQARQQIFWNNYADTVNLEANVTALCLRQILPSMQRYGDALLQIAEKKHRLKMDGEEAAQAKEVFEMTKELQNNTENLQTLTQRYAKLTSAYEKARFAAETLLPAIDAARQIADIAEGVCPPQLWPMPTYGELLFSL